MKEPKIRFKGFEGEWEEKYLNSLASYICSGKNTNMQGPYPLYGSTGIIGSTDKPYHAGPMLLVARVGANAGYLQLIDKECGVSDNTLIIQPNNELPETYLFYYFVHLNLNRFIYGSGQPLITGGMLKKMPVRFGSTIETKKLASFFTTIESQISASTSRLTSLKQIKAASLQAMFPQEGETVPKLRFKGFEGEWEEAKADSLFKTFNEKNRPDLPVLSATQDKGMVTRESIGYNIFHDKANETTYKHILPGQFVIHLRSFQGGFAHSEYEGIVSPAYTIMDFRDKELHDDYYWRYVFTSKEFIKRLELVTYGIRDGRSISYDEFKDMTFRVPCKAEQRAIASYFTSLDRQITLHTQRLKKLKQIKSACLDKMFV